MTDLCGAWTGSSEDPLTGETVAGAIYCKSWHCEHCAPKRRKQLQALAAAGSPSTLITLTMPRNSHSCADHAAQALVHAWRMIQQRGRREGKFGKIQFLAVFEETKKGWPHLHILARCPYIPQRWLSATARHYGAGSIVDIRKVYNATHAARYVAKYVSKAPCRYRGCKRYWTTQQYNLKRKEIRRGDPCARTGRCYEWHVNTVEASFRNNGFITEWTAPDRFKAKPESYPWTACNGPPGFDGHPLNLLERIR